MYTKIDLLYNVISKEECEGIVQYGISKSITSDNISSVLIPKWEVSSIDRLMHTMSKEYNIPIEYFEPACFICYPIGGELFEQKPFFTKDKLLIENVKGGQRSRMIIVSLNSDYIGGEYFFLKLGKSYLMYTGCAFSLSLLNTKGGQNRNTQYDLNFVSESVKYDLVFYIREKTWKIS